MNLFEELANILLPDADRMRALRAVQSLNLPDCWIGAGFVRDAVWDRLHGYAVCPPKGDIDVVWFDRQQTGIDNDLENALAALDPDFTWSVKNQARMHLHNGDAPYQAVSDAMRFWPEIATAVAVRLTNRNVLEINAPLGLNDLFALRLRPTSAFKIEKQDIFLGRIADKRWLHRYPHLQLQYMPTKEAAK